jgi:hypothetical protein
MMFSTLKNACPLTQLLIAWVIVGLFTAGCNRGGSKVHPVQGRILVSGKPAARALVTFHPEHPAEEKSVIRPTAVVDADGSFRLTSFHSGDGAPDGDYRVSVVWYLANPKPKAAEGDDANVRNYLPEVYARAETTPLRATIARGTNNLPTFELRSK